jgi:hypothetical protein
MYTGSQNLYYLNVPVLCNAPPRGWPHEWPKHIGGILRLKYIFTHLCAFVSFNYHI